MPSFVLRRVFGLVAGLALVLLGWVLPGAAPAFPADRPDVRTSAPPKLTDTAATYKIEVGLEGEVYPVFANYASLQRADERRWGTVAVTVINSSDHPLLNRMTVEIPGWSDPEIEVADVAAGGKHTYLFAPSFLPRFYRNSEIKAASVLVTVTDAAGQVVFQQTAPVRLRPVEDMYWGQDFKYAPFIASWVTPHDPRVEQVLARAKEFMPGRRLPGYEDGTSEALQEQLTIQQVRAIYRALHQQGVSYVKSSMAFGGNSGWSERVRYPRESLRSNSANCIDGVLMYASLFENLDMDPVVVLVPGHAYIGVRLTPNSGKYLYVETALTGRASFEVAAQAAKNGLARIPRSQITFIPIHDARQAGIYPMPE